MRSWEYESERERETEKSIRMGFNYFIFHEGISVKYNNGNEKLEATHVAYIPPLRIQHYCAIFAVIIKPPNLIQIIED